MKTAVITIAIRNSSKDPCYMDLTLPSIKLYSEKINAEYIEIQNQVIGEKCNFNEFYTPHWEKFQLYDYLSQYDRVLYIDADVHIKKESPNIFEEFNNLKEIGCVYDSPINDPNIKNRRKHARIIRRIHGDIGWGGYGYVNTGVLVLSPHHKEMFENPYIFLDRSYVFYEQTPLNYLMIKHGYKKFKLGLKFNNISFYNSKQMKRMGGKWRMCIDPHLAYFNHFSSIEFKYKRIKEYLENNNA